MIDMIFNWLSSSSVYPDFISFFGFIVRWLLTFVVNLANMFISPLFNYVFAIFPFDYNFVYGKLSQAFDIIFPFVSYLLDAVIVPKEVLIIVFTSLLFRIAIRKDSFILKLIISWYDKLKP